MRNTPAPALSYRPEIDGLRAIAVTAVVLYHGKALPLPGGFAGVDVFFVLSGYLIAAILLRELQLGQYSILRFYERRARRILPALIVVLTATTVAAFARMIPSQLFAYGQSLLAVVLFVSNFLFGAKSGYFSPALEEAPLLHTWSLSVEEQFYLGFPLLLAFLFRRAPRHIGPILAGLAVASLALAEWGWRHHPDINFFFTFSRGWELLSGAATALILNRRRVAPNRTLAAIGLGLILYALAFHSDATPYPSVATVVPVSGTALLILYARAQTGVGRLLALRPMVAVGLISYSTYLWHQPLFAFARLTSMGAPGPWVMAGLTIASFGLGAATWALVEQPFRRRTARLLPSARGLFVASGIGMAVLAALSAVTLLTAGNDRVWRQTHPDQAASLDLILAAGQLDTPPPQECKFNLTEIDAAARLRIATCAARLGPAAVVLGDSHAIDIYAALLRQSRAPFLLGVTSGGCRPEDAASTCAYDDFAALVAEQPALFSQVLFVQSGAYLLLGQDGRAGSRQLFTRLGPTTTVPPYAPNMPDITRLAAYLDRLAAHVPVTMLAPRIEPHISPAQFLAAGCAASFTLRPGLPQAFGHLDEALLAAIHVAYIPLSAQPFDITTDFTTCTTLFWSDGDHWSVAGEARFGARLLPLLPAAFR